VAGIAFVCIACVWVLHQLDDGSEKGQDEEEDGTFSETGAFAYEVSFNTKTPVGEKRFVRDHIGEQEIEMVEGEGETTTRRASQGKRPRSWNVMQHRAHSVVSVNAMATWLKYDLDRS